MAATYQWSIDLGFRLSNQSPVREYFVHKAEAIICPSGVDVVRIERVAKVRRKSFTPTG